MIYDNKTFIGTAQCHPDDEDVASERVGAIIAESRAAIKYFQYLKEKTKHQIEILYHILSYRNTERTKEQKRIYKLYTNLKNDLIQYDERIKLEKQLLIQYLNEKDKIFQKIRENKKG